MSTSKAQPTTVGVFQAKAQRSGDWWALSVQDHPGIHAQARSLSEANQPLRRRSSSHWISRQDPPPWWSLPNSHAISFCP